MAEDDTQTQPTPDLSTLDPALLNQMLRQTLSPQSYQPPEPPHSGDNRTWGSLLGQALVGGGGPGSTDAQNERAGLQALSNIGLGMMSGSDYSQQRHTLGSIVAGAIGGAQESNAAQNAAQLEYQKTQQEMQLARVREALPLLTLQQKLQQMKAVAAIPSPFGGGGTPTTIATAGSGGIGAVGGDSATRKAAEGGPPASGTPAAATAQSVHDFWISKGFSEAQVAGIMAGGPGSESDFNPTASGDGGTSYGLYQHHGPRLDAMRQYFGLTGNQMPTADQQNQYAAYEISPQGPYAKVGAALKDARTPAEAATIWTRDFGVPKDKLEIPRRAAGADRFSGLYTPQPAAGSAAPGAPQTPPAAAPGVAQGDVARPELAPGPPGSTGGAPIGIGAALAPPVVAGTPLPAGKLQSTGKPPGQAAADTPNVDASGRVIADTRSPQEIRLGGVQVAGPGAGPSLPPSPAVATAATPQPGWGTGAATGYNVASTGAAPPPPGAPPAAVVTAQTPPAPAPIPASTPDAVPDSFEQYKAQHPITPSDDDRASFSTAPDAAQLAVLNRQAQLAQTSYNVAKANLDSAGMAKASEDYNTILAKENEIRQQAAKLGTETRSKFFQDQNQNLFNAWTKAQEFKQQRITAQQKDQLDRASKIDELQQTADIDMGKKSLDLSGADAAESRKVMTLLMQMGPQLENLPNGVVGTLVDKYPELVPILQQSGIVDPRQATNIQMLQSARAYLSLLQKPPASGSLRVTEMNNLASYTPATLNTPQARQEMLGRLLATNQRVIDEHNFASNYFGRTDEKTGKPLYNVRGMDEKMNAPLKLDANGNRTADSGLGPVVPEPPPLTAGTDAHQAYQKYVTNNVRQGFPYYTYRQQTDPVTKQPIVDKDGNRVMQRVMRLKGVNDVGPGG